MSYVKAHCERRKEVRHCGNEKCIGSSCENWSKCRGETIPPWNCKTSPSTASIVISEHDVLEAADRLAHELEAVIDQNQAGDTVIDCGCERIKHALLKYRNARNGVRN